MALTDDWTWALDADGCEPEADEVPEDDEPDEDRGFERKREDEAWPS